MGKEFVDSIKNGQEKLMIISKITLENNEAYYFFSDGNLYSKSNEGIMNKLDKNKNKKLIGKIMKRFIPPKTDVIRNNRKNRRKKQEIIDVDLPKF